MEKPKRDPPVCPDGDSSGSLAIPFQGMQPKRRLIHILNRFRSIERRQYQTQPVDLIRFNFPPFVILEQELQAFMPETADHRHDGKTSVDICQWRRCFSLGAQ